MCRQDAEAGRADGWAHVCATVCEKPAHEGVRRGRDVEGGGDVEEKRHGSAAVVDAGHVKVEMLSLATVNRYAVN
jgi:hypothetical protein